MSCLVNQIINNNNKLEKVVVGRESVIYLLTLATVLGEHLLIVGPPGTAKTLLVKSFFSQFKNSKLFHVTCTERMSEEYLVGPLDMKLFREEGEYVHKVEGSIVTADFAFLDEFIDLPDSTARSLLEILNERTFTRGKQKVECPLRTAIATTNFSADSEELKAVEDRFLFRCRVAPLTQKGQLLKALASANKRAVPTGLKSIPFEDLKGVSLEVDSVKVGSPILTMYVDFVSILRSDFEITDRRVVRGLRVLKAVAYLEGRFEVSADDIITAAKHSFCYGGDLDSEARFSKHATVFYTNTVADYKLNLERESEVLGIVQGLNKDVVRARKGKKVFKLIKLKTEAQDLKTAVVTSEFIKGPSLTSFKTKIDRIQKNIDVSLNQHRRVVCE